MIDSLFPLGTVVAGRFRLDAVVAEGGMGVVYRATELRDRDGKTRDVRPAAIKVIHPRRAADAAYLARFERETDTVVRLQHPNIVPVIDFGDWEGRPYIAFAWIEGEDLGARITRVGPLSLDQTIQVLAPVADALDAAHDSGLVHRDVKPGNILLGTRDETYLTDFGLARASDALAAPTMPGARMMGTAPFIAPEQLRPKTIIPELAPRIDIYALACVAFACLTGDGPFRRDSDEAIIFAHADEAPPLISEVRADLPAGLDAVLTRALAKDPAARFATARSFVTALRQAAAGSIAVVPPTPASERTGPLPEVDPEAVPERKAPSRAPVIAAAGGAVLLLVAIALASLGGGPGPTSSAVANLPTPVPPTGVPTEVPGTPVPATAPPLSEPPITPVPDRFGSPEDQQILLEAIGTRASDCTERALILREIAAVECTVPDSDYTNYSLFASIEESEQDWATYLGFYEVAPNSGGQCAEGDTTESTWSLSGTDVGRIACHPSDAFGWVVSWTDPRHSIWGLVSREDFDYAAAYGAWITAVIR